MDWEQEARRILRAEMSRRGFTYKTLANKLERMDIRETHKSVASKIGRGTFSFAFFLQAMRAMGAQQVDISPLEGDE
jgi:hypothetical protein